MEEIPARNGRTGLPLGKGGAIGGGGGATGINDEGIDRSADGRLGIGGAGGGGAGGAGR